VKDRVEKPRMKNKNNKHVVRLHQSHDKVSLES